MIERDEQFEPELSGDLAALDAALRQALRGGPPPPGLPSSVFDASVQRVREAAGQNDKLARELRRALGAGQAPGQLTDRVYEASAERLRAAALAGELERALGAAAPAGLSDRIAAATAERYEQAMAHPTVAGRIGHVRPTPRWWSGLAAAAAAAIAIGAGLWLSGRPTAPFSDPPIARTDAVDVDTLVAQISATLDRAPTGDLDAELVALDVEMDELAMAFDGREFGGGLAVDGDVMLQELRLLEGELSGF